MTFETSYLLEEFRAMQPELFDQEGKAYEMTNAHGMAEQMLRLIDALEQEIKELDLKLKESYI
jgi:hypothetical protein